MMHARLPHSRRGFALLETILALALFLTVATAMAIALDQLASASLSARRESLLLRRLESEITEMTHLPQLPSGTSQTGADAFGIRVTREVEPITETSQTGTSLHGLYRVRVSATIPERQGEMVRDMETYVLRVDPNLVPADTAP